MPELNQHKIIDPLGGRYTSKEMKSLFPSREPSYNPAFISEAIKSTFSDTSKYLGWRDMWIMIASAQSQLGVNITKEEILAMKEAKENLDIKLAQEYEKAEKHDVVAFKKEYKEKITTINSEAAKKIHLGCTSMEVTDNQELIAIKHGLQIIYEKLQKLQTGFNEFYSFLDPVVEDLSYRIESLKARGAKGATGTQATFLKMFNNDPAKVKKLDELVAKEMGFNESYPITGQTYPRIVDYQVIESLSNLGSALYTISKGYDFGNEFENLNEILEKNADKAALMASNQWLERSLDDSSLRRIILPESFYAIDSMINLLFLQESQLIKNPADIMVYDSKEKYKKPLELLAKKTAAIIKRLGELSDEYKTNVCVAYTHGQFAQPHTHGKRIAIWNQNFVLALKEIEHLIESEYMASDKVQESLIIGRLKQLGIASSKMALDIRLLQHDLELNEPFGKEQKGSSAMPYKKNPMKSERINGLSLNLLLSSNYGLKQDHFYNADSILNLVLSVLEKNSELQKGFTIHTEKSKKILQQYMPFLVAEDIILEGTEHGEDRDVIHNTIRECMIEARKIMDGGGENTMLNLLREKGLGPDLDKLGTEKELLNPLNYIGLSEMQVDEFNKNIVNPIVEKYRSETEIKSDVQV